MTEADVAADAMGEPRQFPGQVLREVREAQGLTLAEVSSALKFSTRQIEALENDDYQQLQGKTFLRGFVRAYARLLRLEAEPLLQMLGDDFSPAPAQIVVPANMGETDPVPFYARHGRKFGIAALLVLLAAGIAWYAGNEEGFLLERHAQPTEVAIPIGQPNAEFSQAATGPETAEPAAVSPSTAPAATAAVPEQPAPEVPALVFEFSDYSWLEVKDASGQVLLIGEFPRGEKKTVTGKPPYQVWIGKASAIKLTYGERVIDVLPHARDDVARLTVE